MRFREHEEAAGRSTQQLLGLFAFVVAGMVVAVNLALALVWWALPLTHSLPHYFVATNTGLVLLYVLGGCAVENSRLSEGGAHVARMAGARQAQPGRGSELGRLEQRFVNVVQEMAIASGQRPPPAAWVMAHDDAINAFAAGWRPDDAVVAVSRGALERLTRAELQGVVAHEFSHLAHGDSALNMRLVGMVWGLQLIWTLGQAMMAPDERGQRRAVFLVGLALVGAGALGWVAGRMLQAAVSRQREFLADASAVKYTRDVEGLGGALRKLADQASRGMAGLTGVQTDSLSHLFFATPSGRGRLHAWFATHPPLAERIARLYGHEVDPIDARVLPLPADDEPVHPAIVALQSRRADVVIGRAVPRQAEAYRNDALQKPAHFDAAAREADALARIDRRHGPGEWQAAMLALAWPGDLADAACDDAWALATEGLAVAGAVRAEASALRPPARRRVLEAMIERALEWAPELRRQRWRELRRRRWPDEPHYGPRSWWLLVLRHRLLAAPSRADARDPMARRVAEAHAATRALALALGVTPDHARAWLQAATQALADMDLPLPAGPGAGLAPLWAAPTLHAALRVRRVAPMQRALLIRAWLQAARGAGLDDRASPALDALHLACLALEVPVPDVLR